MWSRSLRPSRPTSWHHLSSRQKRPWNWRDGRGRDASRPCCGTGRGKRRSSRRPARVLPHLYAASPSAALHTCPVSSQGRRCREEARRCGCTTSTPAPAMWPVWRCWVRRFRSWSWTVHGSWSWWAVDRTVEGGGADREWLRFHSERLRPSPMARLAGSLLTERHLQVHPVGGQAFEPRPRAQAVEDLPGLGKQRFGRLGVRIPGKPLAVLKEGDGQPEGNSQLSQHPGGRLEAGLEGFMITADRGHPGPEPCGLRLQEGGSLPGWQLLDDCEEFLDLAEVAQGECGLGRPDETGLHGLVSHSEHPTGVEGLLSGGEGVVMPALRLQQDRLGGPVFGAFLEVNRGLEAGQQREQVPGLG